MSEGASTSQPPSSASVSAATIDAAVAWYVRLASGQASAADHEAAQRWRRASVEHERAWQRLQGVQAQLRSGGVPADLVRDVLHRRSARRLSRRRVLRPWPEWESPGSAPGSDATMPASPPPSPICEPAPASGGG